jgi:hypothetical protein
MLYINNSQSDSGRVNLGQLAEVRQHHMPAPAVRFASPDELSRVAHEITSQRPELREETTFVVHEELSRRKKLAQPSMQVLNGLFKPAEPLLEGEQQHA